MRGAVTDIPRWPKISLLDDPDEEERARQRLNESRRQRGLPPLYPEAGLPPQPLVFGGIIPGLDKLADPQDVDPGFSKEHFDFVDGIPGIAAHDDRVAKAPAPASPPVTAQRPEGTAPAPAPASDGQAKPPAEAKPAPPGKPLTYDQIKELVRENNRSKLPDEMIIAVIFKESSFNPSARSNNPKSTESGLMQIGQPAWRDVHQNVLKQKKTPDFQSNVFDPATNIQRGSAYLQARIDRVGGDISRGLNGYRGGVEPGYAADVLAATQTLQQNPENPLAALSKAYRRRYP